jgi:hypothetical protein
VGVALPGGTVEFFSTLNQERLTKGFGSVLLKERSGNEPIDDGFHAPLARRRTPRESVARSAVGAAEVEGRGEGFLQSLFLGGFHLRAVAVVR